MFIDQQAINNTIAATATFNEEQFKHILTKASNLEQLTLAEVAFLLQIEERDSIDRLLDVAGQIKKRLYKNRIVLFAPLYISNHCTNNCTYCGYRRDNDFTRRALSKEEIIKEVQQLEQIGHKRLALEVGEDEHNSSFEYVLQAIDWIYQAGDIRRINVNVAATTLENYRLLKEKDIGTYILFQETYDPDQYLKYHPQSLKGNYERQLYAHHRAIEAGIEDVGGGVLYGLSDYRFDTLAMIIHNRELEQNAGVGFHTVSVPRLQQAAGMDLAEYPHIIDDITFEKIIAILRLAIPYTGIILSTRETKEMRDRLIASGVSQISAGSQTDVGGYNEEQDDNKQFSLNDERTPLEVIKGLVKSGLLPSYCTACYRSGRTGDHFMEIVRAEKIGEICAPNALLTFSEYIRDYGDDELERLAKPLIEQELAAIDNVSLRKQVAQKITAIKDGASDLYI